MPFRVQRHQCTSCIYRPQCVGMLPALEAACADPRMDGFFANYRICHHSNDVCCSGFWARHKNAFTLGQIAQRLNMVEYVTVDTLKKGT